MPSDGSERGEAGPLATRVHGTCVAIGEKSVLLRGPPGAGKSDLAFRLIAGPPPEAQASARLVADDQVVLAQENGRLVARAPQAIAGLLEIRGVGIRRIPWVAQSELALLIDLVAAEEVLRLPSEPPTTEAILDVQVPAARLAPFEASAPLKLRALLGAWGASAV